MKKWIFALTLVSMTLSGASLSTYADGWSEAGKTMSSGLGTLAGSTVSGTGAVVGGTVGGVIYDTVNNAVEKAVDSYHDKKDQEFSNQTGITIQYQDHTVTPEN